MVATRCISLHVRYLEISNLPGGTQGEGGAQEPLDSNAVLCRGAQEFLKSKKNDEGREACVVGCLYRCTKFELPYAKFVYLFVMVRIQPGLHKDWK